MHKTFILFFSYNVCPENIYYNVIFLPLESNKIRISILHVFMVCILFFYLFAFIAFYELIFPAESKRGVSDPSPQTAWEVLNLVENSK